MVPLAHWAVLIPLAAENLPSGAPGRQEMARRAAAAPTAQTYPVSVRLWPRSMGDPGESQYAGAAAEGDDPPRAKPDRVRARRAAAVDGAVRLLSPGPTAGTIPAAWPSPARARSRGPRVPDGDPREARRRLPRAVRVGVSGRA